MSKQNTTKNKDKKSNSQSKGIKNVIPVVKVIDKKAMVDPQMKDRNQYHIYPLF